MVVLSTIVNWRMVRLFVHKLLSVANSANQDGAEEKYFGEIACSSADADSAERARDESRATFCATGSSDGHLKFKTAQKE